MSATHRRAWLARMGLAAAALGSSGSGAGASKGTGTGASTGTGTGTGTGAGAGAAAVTASPPSDPVRRGRPMVFPRDHGAHPDSRIEWWYLTGWLHPEGDASPGRLDTERLLGFQVTFFRSLTGLARNLPGRLAPRQLLFAHAAVTDLKSGRHLHAERIARWSGLDDPSLSARASLVDTDLRIGPWQLQRLQGPSSPTTSAPTSAGSLQTAEQWIARIRAPSFTLDLQARPTQPMLLQGDRGYSRKGPQEPQASHYLSLPQLAVGGRIALERAGGPIGGTTRQGDGAGASALSGRAWLDHEWSDELLHPQAVGWDWVGLNLFDGRAVTAFQLRRADGSVLWAGGSVREAPAAQGSAATPGSQQTRILAEDELRFRALQRWRSAATGAEYPVHWDIELPQQRLRVRALLEAQEMDRRGSIGTAYWEGVSEVLDAQGRRIGLGYLEMTGYAGRLRL